MDVKIVIDKALKELDSNSGVSELVNSFLIDLKGAVKKSGFPVSVVLGGSLAKGTFINGDFDVDIFVRFDKEFPDDLSDSLQKILEFMGVEFERIHGSRDYFQVDNDLLFEIVPVRKISNYLDAENVSDMSPLHVEYFLSKTKNNKRIVEDIKLAKLFMKSCRVYGAESYIKGFSGHVVDLLVIYYGSFLSLLENVTKWKDKKIIDIEKHHKFPLMSLNESKIQSPLVVVDPVQQDRNAAAALSKEKYLLFIGAAKRFLKAPCLDFFKKFDFDVHIDNLITKNSKKCDVYEISLKPIVDKRDVSGAKILKVFEHISESLEINDFVIKWKDWYFNRDLARLVFSLDASPLPSKKVVIGPPVDLVEHVKRFKNKYSSAKKEDDVLCAEIQRKYVEPISLFIDLLKSKALREKYDVLVEVKKIS
ncbi:nucleotidyltransferase domain-containing protein [Candidatus Woesearchaeota archaeon]|nr:nucleotidyltransferase domain-containing protein [Candidatus Woesearchaeota archaeon]